MTEARSFSAEPPQGHVRTADVLGALSHAASLAMGVSAEHAVKACYMGMHLARELGLPPREQSDLYYAELLMDAGCTAYTSEMAASVMGDEIAARREFHFYTDSRNPDAVSRWLDRHMAVNEPPQTRGAIIQDFAIHGREFMREAFRSTCEVAYRFAQRLEMSAEVQRALLEVFEQWDGTGMPDGIQREAIPIISRIVYATSYFEAFHYLGGRRAAIELARQRRGTAFDPQVVDAFLSVAEDAAFWQGLEQGMVWETVMAMQPESAYRYIPSERLVGIALCFADYVDLKAPHLAGHSRRVGDLAEGMARRVPLASGEAATIRMAGYVHDMGLVAAPSYSLGKPREKLTPPEWEIMRLHPYHSERILSRVPGWEAVARIAGAHHERMDGRGYHHGTTGTQIPLGARFIAVADRFDELTHDTPGSPAMEPEAAVRLMGREVGDDLSPDAFQALVEELGGSGAQNVRGRHRRDWPAGLTDREVEVLRHAARGLSRRQIADALFVTEGTVRSHLEHIYGKIGVSTRAAAALYAMEHGLFE